MRNLKAVFLILAGLVAAASANFCFVCSSSSDSSCLIPDGGLLMRDCNQMANNNTCFARIVDRHVERGCSASLSREDFAQCNMQNNCLLCYDPQNQGRCNGAIFPEHRLHCHQCHGTTNSTCADEINSTPQLCSLYETDDRCFVSVAGGQVVRGCLSDTNTCQDAETCHTCDGNGCNYKQYEDGAMSVVVSLKTLLMALLAAMAYGSFRQ
ncbi:uncharacterized protein LOC129758472 isoform X2 [Uranotaenia lowii]|uniref:uncharacterized protein LOC129758472 isoform X2 n=1 Tax=Uranotaenia lowii TaxID=190385 RepID=UPI00247858F0|nr:uncharacterized protein LOC129758472 isoform X2 [Uranotaenia lowii]